ncbi:MAG: molecular chaperone TorD family protein [Raoultibacter sp.]
MTDQIAETTDISSLMLSRAQTYGLISRIFRVEADREFLDEMRAMRFPTSTGNENVDEGYKLLYTYLKKLWDESVTELAIDYVRTFVGHGVNAFSAAYPFESVHTSERRLLMQEARDEVLAIYRANNLKRGDTWNEGEDHIALELEFMQIMANRTAEALDAGDEDGAIALLRTQYGFLEDHLINWVPMLVSDMGKFAQTDFYKGAALLLLGFIETDEELLRDLLEDED